MSHIILFRPGGSKFEVVRPRAGVIHGFFFQLGKECGLGYGSVHKVGGCGGMLPQENFEIYNL